MRELTREAQAELGIEDKFRGKVWAFVPVTSGYADGPTWALGIAVANERGYCPVPPYWCHAEEFAEMVDHARDLNEARGLSVATSDQITVSTMQHGLPPSA